MLFIFIFLGFPTGNQINFSLSIYIELAKICIEMTLIIKPRKTYLITTDEKKREHLFFILTDVDNNGEFVMVNISTFRDSMKEEGLILDVGDHPYIKRRSIVLYGYVEIYKYAVFQAKYNLYNSDPEKINKFIPKTECTEVLFEKLKQGLLTSRHTKKKVKEDCKRLWS